MRRRIPLGFIAALLAIGTLLGQESDLGARRETVETARAIRDGVAEKMAATYKEIEADFLLVRSERWAALSAPLLRAIEEHGDAATALAGAFGEAELLSGVVCARLAGAVAELRAEAEPDPTPDDTLAAALKQVFPAKTFADCWDSAFLDLPIVAEWKSANEDLRLAEEALAAMEQSAAADPEEPPGMVLVPRGRFVFGPWVGITNDLDRNEESKESVNAFYIDVYEVTNAEFLDFLGSLSKESLIAEYLPTTFKREGAGPISFPEGAARRPVTGVTYPAAAAYAEWKGLRLPTENEWEKAARGENGLPFPWGAEFVSDALNWSGPGLERSADVGSFESDRSPYGAHDMAGNVSEITATLDGRRDVKRTPRETDKIVYRGASYTTPEAWATPRYRSYMLALTGSKADVGFRCAISERDWKKRR